MAPSPPFSDPAKVVRLLRRGDLLFLTFLPEGRFWALVRGRRPVPAAIVAQLLAGGRFGRLRGRLVAQGDGLLPAADLSQTWRWAEG